MNSTVTLRPTHYRFSPSPRRNGELPSTQNCYLSKNVICGLFSWGSGEEEEGVGEGMGRGGGGGVFQEKPPPLLTYYL